MEGEHIVKQILCDTPSQIKEEVDEDITKENKVSRRRNERFVNWMMVENTIYLIMFLLPDYQHVRAHIQNINI